MTTPPDLADYRAVHGSLRLAARHMAATVTGIEPGDRDRAAAFARYWRGYAGEVLAHHTIEDDVMFPRLVARVPVAAGHLERVAGDHHRLDELMDAGHRAVARLAAGPTGAAAEAAGAVLRELSTHMDAHLDFEDEDIVPLFGRHFTAEEYEALGALARKQLGLGRQAAFTVPFVVHWAPKDGATLMGEAAVPLRILYRLTRRGHARLTQAALGPAAAPEAVSP